uniref:Zinc finger C2H2-type domain-containing protein n=1 Tax=Moumouvirus sp. 'Monve' TaxID=1128131 RepID=H6WBF1_9VIRU|nr:zinc finger C2H2-type domain-containing protein [Moumouvirus Monve]
MSLSTIKKLNTDQLLLLHDRIVLQFLKKSQQEYDEKTYPVKTPNDKLICLTCGGSYIRQKNLFMKKLINIQEH